jgi:acyl-CoA synthetase (AMP-forming)/AMP-acid ligase II
VRLVAAHGVTALIAVPAMAEDMVAALAAAGGPPDPATTSDGARAGAPCLPSVRRLLVGGGGMRPRLAPLVRRLFPNAVVSSAYGMTEAASSITFLVPEALDTGATGEGASSSSSGGGGGGGGDGSSSGGGGVSGGRSSVSGERDSSSSSGTTNIGPPGGACVGVAAPGVLLAVAAPGSLEGADCGAPPSCSGVAHAPPGVVGEVLTRGPHVMARYWGDPRQTRQVRAPRRPPLGQVLLLLAR